MRGLALLCAFSLQAAQEDLARRTRDLIEKLRSDSVEERLKAQEDLEGLGDAALPALRKAAAETRDAEVQARVRAAVEELERLGRERLQDSKERERLLEANRKEEDVKKEKEPGAVAAGGARFILWAAVRKEGFVLYTYVTNYLRGDRITEDVTFDFQSVTDLDGKELALERCGRCSPGVLLVKDTVGPVRVRVKGVVLWFSPYLLEFSKPANGDRRKVGDFSFELDWPSIRVAARRARPKEIWQSVGDEFTYEVEPGVSRPLFGKLTSRLFAGSISSFHWCRCRNGPQPVAEKPKPELSAKFVVKSGSDRQHALADVTKITYLFQKPIEEPIEFTLDVAASKK